MTCTETILRTPHERAGTGASLVQTILRPPRERVGLASLAPHRRPQQPA